MPYKLYFRIDSVLLMHIVPDNFITSVNVLNIYMYIYIFLLSQCCPITTVIGLFAYEKHPIITCNFNLKTITLKIEN